MRALEPDQVFALPSGLWVLDARQPVAAVLDPVSGAVLRLVSWRALPPADRADDWPAPPVFSDGSGLWAQERASGPLVRVDPQGVRTAVWTGGRLLAACGPEQAWCASVPPGQELVAGPDPHPVRQLGGDSLLRVDADGSARVVRTEHPVRTVQADAEGLLVQVDVDGWTLRHLGADLHEVLRPSRWLRLPWHDDVPEQLSLAEHGLAEGFVPGGRTDAGGSGPFFWYDDVSPPGLDLGPARLVVLGLVWRLGWVRGPSGAGRRAVATAHDLQGAEVCRWDLGAGTVKAATPAGARLCVVLGPNSDAATASPAAGRVVALDPASPAEVTELLADGAVDIAEQCRPLVPRPIDVESYLAQTLAANGGLETYWHSEPDATGATRVHPLAAGLSDVRTALVGDWPHTHLQWTFSYAPYPGLVLRRRVPLFDELGRPDPPEYADIGLMEDLDTGNLPPATQARDGVLDV